MPDYWGLAGISKSKVPGVAGIGPRSAAQLLVEFQSLEGIYENLDAVAEKWRKKLETHKEMAFLCRDIARLQTNLHIDGNLQQLRLGTGASPDTPQTSYPALSHQRIYQAVW